MSIHQNYIKASNFMFLSVGLGIINIILTPGIFVSPKEIITGIIVLLFLAGLALGIKKGISWIKYLLLILIIIGLLGIPFMIKNLGQNLAIGIINIIQTVLQIWSLILLFKIPKEEAK